MVTFRFAQHALDPSTEIVEVWREERLIAAIYPTRKGIKVISKYFSANPEIEIDSTPPPTAIVIQIP